VWEVEPNLLDYETYLPMFFGGLMEIEEPYALFARRGIMDMLQHGDDEAVADAVPLLIPPLRGTHHSSPLFLSQPLMAEALLTKDAQICVVSIEALQALIQVGEKSTKALLPYVKNILPCFRRLILTHKWQPYDDKNLDDAKRGGTDLQTIVEETLHLLHRYGGSPAYKLIKAMIPMYEAQR